MDQERTKKNKIGARSLTEPEARLILPTYDRIYDQIEQFRGEKSSGDRGSNIQDFGLDHREYTEKNRDIDQKTNNIGIIGVRGAGKTSVLKTIRAKLQRENSKKDIILPIIVPENMSKSGTLMATILGMLSNVVAEREEKRKKGKNKDCIGKSELSRKCDEALRQYTFIQEEYRDVLIHEYTTENDYVKSSAKVFNSDTEFIHKFNQLVEELLSENEQKDSLLFVFIDDIDLSTYRCADVVRTLLSYLSNENIVTVISGDLETFEEALTLDFLRKENALNNDILEKEFGNQSILNSKKKLAYEYLKKILPPAYRHNIKYWSLEEKGNYCIMMDEKEGADTRKLSDLLREALKGWVAPEFFDYAELKNESESDGTKTVSVGVLPYSYILFDSTSRGLNNIYNILNDIIERRAQEGEEGDYIKEKKLLLDTIVSSREIYNRYREVIQKKLYTVGLDSASNKVFFDNAYSAIYGGETHDLSSDKSAEKAKPRERKKQTENYPVELAADRFSLFLLVDFAARLLYEKGYEKIATENENYVKLKIKAMEDFFFHPEIAEKMLETACEGWGKTEPDKLRKIAYEDLSWKTLNKCFLLKGDLALNLAYYRNLPLDRMLKLYEDGEKSRQEEEDKDELELGQTIIFAFWKALSSVAKVNGEDILDKAVSYTPVFTREFLFIRDHLSASVEQNVVIQLFDGLWETAHKSNKQDGEEENKGGSRTESQALQQTPSTQETEEEKKKKQEKERRKRLLKRIVMNLVANYIVGHKDASIMEIQEGENLRQILDADGKPFDRAVLTKRINVLKAIDLGDLWEDTTAEVAIDYLRNEISRYFVHIEKGLEWKAESATHTWKLNINVARKSWLAFQKSADGVSDTVSKRTKRKVREILKDGFGENNFERNISFETYSEMLKPLEDLARNYYVWYGRAESQNVVDFLRQSYAEPDRDESWEEMLPYFVFLLRYYYKYRNALEHTNNIGQKASALAKIVGKLSEAYTRSDNQTFQAFITQLNRQLSEGITIEEYENIFSRQAKAGTPQ